MNGCATDRSQFRVTTFDQDIGSRNPVRIIDAFGDALDLKKIGIYETPETAQGRPKAASERDLLKLHIYGAMKKIHSSRELEEACRINVEVRWLIRGQTPKHTVISEFRSKNIKCIRKVYLMFTDMLIRYLSTIHYQSLDGSKFKASNAKDANFTLAKLDDRIKWKQDDLAEHERQIQEYDKDYKLPTVNVIPYNGEVKKAGRKPRKKTDPVINGTQIGIEELTDLVLGIQECMEDEKEVDEGCNEEKMEKGLVVLLLERIIKGNTEEQATAAGSLETGIHEGKGDVDSANGQLSKEDNEKLETLKGIVAKKQEILERYLGYRKYMEEKGISQLALSDPDAKLMKSKNGFMVSYNVQALIDAESHILSDYRVTSDPGDCGNIFPTVKRLKARYPTKILEVVGDKGYQATSDMGLCLEEGIIPHIIMDLGEDEYIVEFVYEPAEITDEEKKSTDSKTIKKCLRAGVVPGVYEQYLTFDEIYTKHFYENEIVTNSTYEVLREEQILQLVPTGYFIRDLETNRVYCPQKEILRQKCVKKNGSIRYANKEACRNCKAKKAGYCTTSDFKEIDFPDKKTVVKCGKWPEPEYECGAEGQGNPENKEGNTEDKGKNSAAKDESPGVFKPPRIKRQLKDTKQMVRMKLKPDRSKMRTRFSLSEHPFGTIKSGMRRESFSLRGIDKVDGEFALTALSYNIKAGIRCFGYKKLTEMVIDEHKYEECMRPFGEKEREKLMSYYQE